MKMKRKCRIWWPSHLTRGEFTSSSLLFGWFISNSSASLDIVVAFAFNEFSSSQSQSSIAGILSKINDNMPIVLQQKSLFSVLGKCSSGFQGNNHLFFVGMEEDDEQKSSYCDNPCALGSGSTLQDNYGRWNCGCYNSDGYLEQCKQSHTGSSNWIVVTDNLNAPCATEVRWVPNMHHMHWNGQIVSDCDVHVIFYDPPMFGHHHFLLHAWNPSVQKVSLPKKPKWVDELHRRQSILDLDDAILAINCSGTAKMLCERHLEQRISSVQRSTLAWRFLSSVWTILAISLASISTLVYIMLQCLRKILSYASNLWLYKASTELFKNSWINIRIRCCQILYWSIILQEHGHGSLSNVENAEATSLHRHSMWSSLAVDILMGNMMGVALLCHAQSASSFVLDLTSVITNHILRSGCVWLMGIPAGFKLNTELAGFLGYISLNAIQIWSTLWIFVGFIFVYVIKTLAILGILFGATVPAALIIDLIGLATFHLSTLHWLISLLYSSQIKALAALWRLFRGQKWNPLRQRLDSYDYIVTQHVVGSLLFTPLLLLLPTTSVFYIFFTIMNVSITFINMLIEVTISVIHATPYIKIFLWFMRKTRFPSGIWFDNVTCWDNSNDLCDSSLAYMADLTSVSSHQKNDLNRANFKVLVSSLRGNYLSIGEIILPHYNEVFSGVSVPNLARSVRGIITGQRYWSSFTYALDVHFLQGILVLVSGFDSIVPIVIASIFFDFFISPEKVFPRSLFLQSF